MQEDNNQVMFDHENDEDSNAPCSQEYQLDDDQTLAYKNECNLTITKYMYIVKFGCNLLMMQKLKSSLLRKSWNNPFRITKKYCYGEYRAMQ